MAITTQDLVKGIDITGEVNIGGSQLNQLVDAARAAVDKGLTITTTDTAANTPEVPDPNAEYSGVFPTWWINYLWIRRPFVTETSQRVLCYMWDENVTPDATLLQWTLVDFNGTAALALATSHTALITTAQNTADTALTNANNAQTSADAAQGDVDTLNGTVTAMAASIEALDNELDSLWGSGDLKHTCKTTPYSTTEDQGWLECDGSVVSRDTFASLFAAIGITFGAGDGSTTFKIPDFRGRCLVGAGTGSGLTARVLGQQTIGGENDTITAADLEHYHGMGKMNTSTIDGQFIKRDWTNTGPQGTALLSIDTTASPTEVAAVSTGSIATGDQIGIDDITVTNMQPSAVSRILIKT